MTVKEALTRWNGLRDKVTREALDDQSLHAELHALFAVISPAVRRGEINLEAL